MNYWKYAAIGLLGMLLGGGVALAASSRYAVSDGNETVTKGNTQLGFFRITDTVTGKCYLLVRVWGVGGAGAGMTETSCD